MPALIRSAGLSCRVVFDPFDVLAVSEADRPKQRHGRHDDVPVAVIVKRGPSVTDGVYLTTDPVGRPLNNLDELPDC